MNNSDLILKSIRFIEDNLKNEITIVDCANHVCYSLYHFIRMFQNVTGFTPKNYIQKRRLTEALNELKNSKKKVFEIAFEYQFGSHENFTRAFQRQFGISPMEIKKRKFINSVSNCKPNK